MKFIYPDNEKLTYMGRIDDTDKKAPVFIWACSLVKFRCSGTKFRIKVQNFKNYYNNYIGVIIDGEMEKFLLPPDDRIVTLDISKELEDTMHEIIVYKRMDGCHYFKVLGFEVDDQAELGKKMELPVRKMEFFGDSVSCGEVSEACWFEGEEDPQHNGEFSNSWWGYSFITARNLGAQIHDTSQGGIPLLDGTGYYEAPDYLGMESCYDKLRYSKSLGSRSDWDFSKYTPHVVVVAIGQNDSNPENYMHEDYDGEKAKHWRAEYEKFLKTLRRKYPNALIVLTTTILGHDKEWDQAIDDVCKNMQDDKVVHFLYTNNGCGTKGHIRKSEAIVMAYMRRDLRCLPGIR